MTRVRYKLSNYLSWLGALSLALLTVGDSLAQCGSLGDPIVNITFGQDEADFGEGTTTYRPVLPGQSPQGEGWYTLVTNVNLALASWHNLRDHTGDTGGMMVVFNADDYPGEFYRIRVSGLCQNTRFRFSAWIANANRAEECGGNPIPPNVRFVIEDLDGNLVSDPYSTGNIYATTSPQWREYGFEFDTGNQTEFDLVLINDNPGGCGNDLAIDDIQFRPCGPLITLAMDEALKQADTLFFCDGATAPILLSGSIVDDDSYAAGAAYQWQISQNGQSGWVDIRGEQENELAISTPVHNQWYRLTAAATADNLDSLLCRISSAPIRIARIAPQVNNPDIQETGPICDDGSKSLNPLEYTGAGVGPITYQWLLDEGDGNVPREIPGATSGNYEFQANGMVGIARLQRQAINVCGDRFVTHTFAVEVVETVHTRFALPQQAVCADDQPLLLSGGVIDNGDAGMQGVYSGNGVSNGYFYPDMAGIGSHMITFSPPSGTLCFESSQAIITVYDTIYLEQMLPMVMLPGQSVTLRPQTNASQFSWSNQPGLDSYSSQYTIASPDETTTYTLTASNAAGCEKPVSVTVTVLQNLVVPNSFTPNGDGVNDVWEIDGLEEYPNNFIQVFNRWGTLVFSAKGYSAPWDGQFNGTQLPVGTYYYTLSSDILMQPLSGSVSILR
ncbi:hypothetical protein GCM10007415_18450 [Parapedobacter pyrenivorans]|uniref:Gliding motility-associated C-terminal domain-containing protein n=1 Tax=Parapedobacter pyrenivorans TaxID=1305674 RepID=A0A917HPG4_9SPHI|nr:gliding motility-associated C-terminal domain-containing protein [Parapedobacter pyrenivorans]GGG85439.1 hypothetical protein GCM10007415_18450 [Parapedobacter pyrenivorans]